MSFIKKGLNILVIGDIMIDHYIYGDCNRISPEAPVPVVEVKKEIYTLGGAGNVLKNIKSLESNVEIISVIGDDENKDIIFKHLLEYNIDINGLVEDATRCTTVKSRVLAANHQLIRLDREITKPIGEEIGITIFDLIKEKINKSDIVLISDYNKGLLTERLLNQIFELCRKTGVKTIVDPKGLDFRKYQGVNFIKPNKKEAIAATGITINNKTSLEAACKKIKEQTKCDTVIITMSEEGIAYYSDGKLDIIPTKALDVIDVTGAGDTVLASLALALGSGNTLHAACEFANHAAAIVVTKIGSATVTLQEINDKLLINP